MIWSSLKPLLSMIHFPAWRVTGGKLQAWKLRCATAAKQVWMLSVKHEALNVDRRNASWVTYSLCAVMKSIGYTSASSLSAQTLRRALLSFFAYKQPHQLGSSPGWANRGSTCRLKQFHVWMSKCHLSETITSSSLSHFCLKKNNEKSTNCCSLFNRGHSVT